MKEINNLLKKISEFAREFTGLCLTIGVVVAVFFAFQFGFASSVAKTYFGVFSEGNEIEQIKLTTDLDEQVILYKKLIERVGVDEAQEKLYLSGLPFTGQTHLLNHAIGDYLYENYGPSGLSHCKEYFLSSCYHGFILHAIGVGGMPEVVKTFNYCLPLGRAVFSQCAHAIGHGFLANVDYKNLPEALKLCDQIGSSTTDFPLYNCYDGVFMENIWGVHDGQPSANRWINPKDIFYPCDAKEIDGKYLSGCWSNQPSLAYQFLGGDIKKVADNLCVKVSDRQNREMCFDGLSRQIHPLTEGRVDKTLALCGLLPPEWQNFCISVNASSSFSVGDRTSPFEVCSAVADAGKRDCYERLFSVMTVYTKSENEFKSMCSQVKDERWKTSCLNRL